MAMVKMTTPMGREGDLNTYKVGDLADLPDHVARRFIDRGLAVPAFASTDFEEVVRGARMGVLVFDDTPPAVIVAAKAFGAKVRRVKNANSGF